MQNMEESFSRFDDKTTHRYFVITHVDPNDDVLVVNRSTYRTNVCALAQKYQISFRMNVICSS